MNEFDLVDLNSLLLLQSLLDREHLIVRLKVQSLFAACQCFDEYLGTGPSTNVMECKTQP